MSSSLPVLPLSQHEQAQLLQAAQHSAQAAYAPYSQFTVGAALLLSDGSVFTGANIENASYGLSMCAERVALFKALSSGASPAAFRAMAVWGGKASQQHTPQHAITPCGACRQVLAEFVPENFPIIISNAQTGEPQQLTQGQLLPHHFTL